jgi:hypothetical protein
MNIIDEIKEKLKNTDNIIRISIKNIDTLKNLMVILYENNIVHPNLDTINDTVEHITTMFSNEIHHYIKIYDSFEPTKYHCWFEPTDNIQIDQNLSNYIKYDYMDVDIIRLCKLNKIIK